MKARIAFLFVAILMVLGVSRTQADGGDFPKFPADNPAAPFIDSRAVAIAQGATAEWRKMEGVAFDASNKRFYVAVTAIAKGMSDDKGDIQMKENACGAVFMGQLDDQFNLVSLKPVVVGGPYDKDTKTCNPDAIASPDNLFVDAKGNLWIGEDTDYHHNQMLWMWNGTDLKRFATLPEGAETTGLHIGPDGTLFSNVQHPNASNLYPYNRATIGVINGFKAGDDFKAIPVPQGDDMKRLVIAGGTYQVLGRTGETIVQSNPAYTFGRINTATGTQMGVCNNPDGNMYLPTAAAGSEGYLYTNWECTPGGVSKLYIKMNADKKWDVIEGDNVDFSSVGGTWNNCNASVSPWNTALTAEEYPADVEGEWTDGWLPVVDKMKAHLGYDANPYNYGYVVELTPNGGEEDGIGTKAVKHYVMGRFSHEMSLIMPDQKTAYSGDDGTDRVLFKFVADKAGDLSAGTLYAAKIKQDGDTLNIEWVKLGSGNDADVAKAIADLAPKK